MPSDAAKRRQAQKKEKKQASSRAAQKKAQGSGSPASDRNETSSSACASGVTSRAVTGITEAVDGLKVSARSCTGNIDDIAVCIGI